jgi:hypothetical protein
MAHKLDERKWNIPLMCEKLASLTYNIICQGDDEH